MQACRKHTKSVEQITAYKHRFYEGCAKRKVSKDVVGTVWDMFISFAGYSFCKPHSASYALVSFKSAYLKAHYPAEFMAAVLSNGGGYYSTFAYISEARRMGMTVLGPDANESEWRYQGKERIIRMGLQQLEGIRRETPEAILDERGRNGPFKSLEDFLRRMQLNPSDASVLVKSGCLDSLAAKTRGELNRPQTLWFVESWLNRKPYLRSHGGRGQLTVHVRPATAAAVPRLPDLSPQQKWQHEMETLGFVLSVHPLTLFEAAPHALGHPVVSAEDLRLHIGRRVWMLGWPITRKEVLTREGEPMEFVSFEDKTAIYETVFFPEAFQRFCQELDMGRAYLLYGQVESELGAVSLTVHRIRQSKEAASEAPPQARFRVRA